VLVNDDVIRIGQARVQFLDFTEQSYIVPSDIPQADIFPA
jgi:hypothetical protein